MKRLQKVYLQLFLVLCVAVSLTSIFPTLSHQAAIPVQIAHLDDCAIDAIAPSTPQSEGAYVANSNTGKFHYAGCRYVNMMSPSHKVFYDNRDEAINAGFVPCKVCRP
ncbi:Ada metal-binding domain-containing protein [Pelosinus sp. IPA-1]|uniref:Ada metal-binding domain-containing protein n=1 Tax=Pelosinus sp. IPA-1 TaxID=3029569 RepID=UPI0024362442|nr:Ada metal-binding domain-containing protein [Pelosinus sp. IPA-1]GMA99514.1 hypothetical protein PIPA1_23140 [Pelosinus sp. IPA-1]